MKKTKEDKEIDEVQKLLNLKKKVTHKAGEDTENLIKKVIRVIKNNPKLQRDGCYGLGKTWAYALEDDAGNRVFINHAGLFGITEHDGRCIRAFFQEAPSLRNDKDQEAYIQGLIDSA